MVSSVPAVRSDPAPTCVGGSLVGSVLVSMVYGQRTGVLEVTERSSVRITFLYFDRGQVVFAERGTLSDALGRVLVENGRLTEAQYAKVIDRVTSQLVDNEQMRFGEAAIELGFLRLDDVNAALRQQVRRKLVHCMQWQEVRCRFSESEEPLAEVTHFPSAVLPLVVEGVRLHWGVERLTEALRPVAGRYPRLSSPPDTLVERLGLHPTEQPFLESLDGRRSIEEVCSHSAFDSVHTRQLLVCLILTEAVELYDGPVAGDADVVGGRGRSPEDRGGSIVPPPLRVDVRSLEAVGPPSRPARRAPTPADPHRRAAQLRSMLGARPRTSEPIENAPVTAADWFQRGQTQVGHGAFGRAHEAFARAVDLDPGEPLYRLHELWASYRADPDLHTHVMEVMDELASSVLSANPHTGFAWHIRGRVALNAGDDAGALKHLRRAARLDPGDLEAARWVRLLASRTRA